MRCKYHIFLEWTVFKVCGTQTKGKAYHLQLHVGVIGLLHPHAAAIMQSITILAREKNIGATLTLVVKSIFDNGSLTIMD